MIRFVSYAEASADLERQRRAAEADDPIEDVVYLMARAIAGTRRALLVELDGDRRVWLPRSQIDADSEVRQPGDEGVLMVTAWIARQRGLAP